MIQKHWYDRLSRTLRVAVLKSKQPLKVVRFRGNSGVRVHPQPNRLTSSSDLTSCAPKLPAKGTHHPTNPALMSIVDTIKWDLNSVLKDVGGCRLFLVDDVLGD